MIAQRKVSFGWVFLMWLLSIAPDSETLSWHVQSSRSRVCLGLGSNLGSGILFGSVGFSSLTGRSQCSPSLLNQMQMLESMNITVILQSYLCYREALPLWPCLNPFGLHRFGESIQKWLKQDLSFLFSFSHSLSALSFFYPITISLLWIPHPMPFLLIFSDVFL